MATSLNKYPDRISDTHSPRVNVSQTDEVEFDFGKFFNGHTRASGWFCDTFGRPKRHFCGDFFGHYDGDMFVLNEKLFYTDGVVETRVWNINVSDDGLFVAESESLIGNAHGVVEGNTLNMRYSMLVQIAESTRWKLDMKDQMILQPDGSLHNITHVYKWGLRIGTVSAQYQHHDGDQLCERIVAHDPQITGQTRKVESHLSSVGRR